MSHEPHPITHAQGLLEGVLRSLDKVDEINKEGLKRVLFEVAGLLQEIQEKQTINMNKEQLELVASQEWFHETVDLELCGVSKLSKDDLLQVISILNKRMIDSTDLWDGG